MRPSILAVALVLGLFVSAGICSSIVVGSFNLYAAQALSPLAILGECSASLLVGDASKARRELNWEPKVKFKELVRLMVDADMATLRRRQPNDL